MICAEATEDNRRLEISQRLGPDRDRLAPLRPKESGSSVIDIVSRRRRVSGFVLAGSIGQRNSTRTAAIITRWFRPIFHLISTPPFFIRELPSSSAIFHIKIESVPAFVGSVAERVKAPFLWRLWSRLRDFWVNSLTHWIRHFTTITSNKQQIKSKEVPKNQLMESLKMNNSEASEDSFQV